MRNAGYPQRRAVAAALRTADQYGKRAAGGSAPTAPTYGGAAPSINANGFVPVPGGGSYNGDPTTTNQGGPALNLARGSLTPDTQAALQSFAMRGLPGGPNGASSGSPAAGTAPALLAPTAQQNGEFDLGLGQATTSSGGNKRGGRIHRAMGGPAPMDPMSSYEQRHAMHAGMNAHPAGLVHTAGPGRTDNVPMTVAPGSHVIPSDVVSAIGQGSTMAGAHALGSAMQGGPGGIALPKGPMKSTIPRPPAPAQFARGGEPRWEGHAIPVARGGAANGVKCILAGGEYLIPPSEVERITHNGKKSHAAIDDWIMEIRGKTIKTLRKLPGPVGMKK